MIRRLLFFLLLPLILFSCKETDKKQAIVTIDFPALADEQIQLLRLDKTEAKLIQDIRLKENKIAEIHLELESPAFYSLQKGKQKIFFVLHPDDHLNISSSNNEFASSYHITGSLDSDILQKFIEYIQQEDAKRDSLISLREAAMGNIEFITIKHRIDSTFRSLLLQRKEYVAIQIRKNPSSLSNLILINKPFGMQRAMDERDEFQSYHILDTALINHYPDNYWVKDFHDKVEKIRFSKFDEFTQDERLEPNKKAPNMVLFDTSGQRYSVKRYGFEKKPVLLYFWGSWDESSIAFNKKLKAAYKNLFEDNNISIMAISLDNSKKVWKMTIERQELPWLNVSDLRGMNSEVLEAYNLSRKRLPMFYFINDRRRIVFRTQDIDSCLIKVQNWQNERLDGE
jgi:peroxiredoxin